jgi:hypothetical protein
VTRTWDDPALEATRRDELNDAITAEILNQLGERAEMVGDAIVISGRGATDVDLLIDVERIIDAILGRPTATT